MTDVDLDVYRAHWEGLGMTWVSQIERGTNLFICKIARSQNTTCRLITPITNIAGDHQLMTRM